MISVVVPAYNEEAVIERSLKHLTDGAPEGELEVIVACNGCHDRTADLARAFGRSVKVVETKTASKVAAMNLGDLEATGFPRFYVDADVIMPWASIKALADEMQRTGQPTGGPRLKMGLEHASVGVRAFYAVWMRMSFHKAGMVGCGAYALSEAGRGRFGEFPDLIADDGYVRSLFVDSERALPPEGSGYVLVQSPATLGDLIKIKTRSRLGLAQLKRFAPDQTDRGLKKCRFFYKELLLRPWLWPAAVVYLYVNLRSRARAARQLGSIESYEWERDDSARQAAAAAN